MVNRALATTVRKRTVLKLSNNPANVAGGRNTRRRI
jgi:hypothetical protein